MEKAGQMEGFRQVQLSSADHWEKIWKKTDIVVEGDRFAQKLLRMHIYHLMVTASPHNIHFDAGIPARGLHGEAYRGHIFWDELYILQFYAFHLPDVTRSILMYRYRRLDKAREYAKAHGYEGAMFPWQSGSDGREETQVLHLNPVSGEWGDDYSSLQRHVSLAIAYNIWYYYWITGDEEFMLDEGGEMILEICRFWASKARLDEKTQRYSITRVMGPDEFHEHLPGSGEGGLKDNAYSNIMTVWLFRKVLGFLEELPEEKTARVRKRIGLSTAETEGWQDMAEKMNLVISDEGIISQFEGYFDLKELDWDHYREKYGNIYRMDRILKAEGKSPDDYKVAKQADTLMAFYNLEAMEIEEILDGLGYGHGDRTLGDNFDFYIQRTSHGSTLSRIVHAYLANRLGRRELAWDLYMEALSSDYVDIQGGTTGEGIHAGVMGSTLLFVIRSIAGMQFHGRNISMEPQLPEGWKKVKFGFAFRKNSYTFEIFPDRIIAEVNNTDGQTVEIEISGKVTGLSPGEKTEVIYRSI
jgi:trehalose/maltose hydrolase-like predicted phosphorylase